MSQTSTDVQIFSTAWAAASAELAAIRRDVFIDEQQVPEDLEWDGEDDAAQHWLARVDGVPVGTVRLLRNGHVGRMAVRREWRRGGIGSALLQHVIAAARSASLRELYLHAQTHALDFYARHSFVVEGPEFMDAGIPHRTMRLQLRTQRQLGLDHGKFPARNRKATALDIAEQTRRHLRILSDNLDPTLYAREEFARAISRMVRNYRSADVRLLIADSSGLSPSGHALLALQRRLSSAIQIRKLGDVTETIDENYLIADGCGLLCYSVRDPDMAWADYNNVPLANDYTAHFDELWQSASEDPNLRLLHL
jgi:predicted GNAT family N-acyltransferase